MQNYLVLVAVVSAVVMLGGIALMLKSCYKIVTPGNALVRNGVGGMRVSFTGGWVFPVLHRACVVDVSMKRVDLARRGEQAFRCADGTPVDLLLTFYLRPNPEAKDVLTAVAAFGHKNVSNPKYIQEYFHSGYEIATEEVVGRFTFEELFNERDQFKEALLTLIPTLHNGFLLEDVAIDHLEKTPGGAEAG